MTTMTAGPSIHLLTGRAHRLTRWRPWRPALLLVLGLLAQGALAPAEAAAALPEPPGLLTGAVQRGLIGRLDLRRQEIVIAGQRFSWEAGRLRVTVGGQVVEPAQLQVGLPVRFVVDPASPAERRIVTAIELETVL